VGGDFAIADTGHDRVLSPIDELMRQKIVEVAELDRCEVIAIVLYTGPMVSRCGGSKRRAPRALAFTDCSSRWTLHGHCPSAPLCIKPFPTLFSSKLPRS
jgi:hypothetical protein